MHIFLLSGYCLLTGVILLNVMSTWDGYHKNLGYQKLINEYLWSIWLRRNADIRWLPCSGQKLPLGNFFPACVPNLLIKASLFSLLTKSLQWCNPPRHSRLTRNIIHGLKYIWHMIITTSLDQIRALTNMTFGHKTFKSVISHNYWGSTLSFICKRNSELGKLLGVSRLPKSSSTACT